MPPAPTDKMFTSKPFPAGNTVPVSDEDDNFHPYTLTAPTTTTTVHNRLYPTSLPTGTNPPITVPPNAAAGGLYPVSDIDQLDLKLATDSASIKAIDTKSNSLESG
jgi:hypothetical protein